jgi:hypothetical protein
MPVVARQSMQWHRLSVERSETESSKTSCAASPHRHEMGRVIASVAMKVANVTNDYFKQQDGENSRQSSL